MKIVLTGCHGQLGTALQDVLTGHQLICTDSDNLDITDRQQVEGFIARHAPNLVINAAAYTQVDQAEQDEEQAYRVNAHGPAHLAKACQSLQATLLQISTDYVFDGYSQQSWCESDITRPLSVYGKSKLAGEQAVAKYCERHFIVRTAWLYHYTGENFLRTMFRLSERDEVKVVDDQRGSPTNADDLAQALQQLISGRQYGIHHMVNRGAVSWYELTCEFYRQLGIKTPVLPVSTAAFPRPAPRPASSVLESEREPRIQLPDWQQGVARLVSQIRQQGWS